MDQLVPLDPKETLGLQVPLDLQDLLDSKDLKAILVFKVAQVTLGRLGLLDHLVHKGSLVHLDLEETLELLAHLVREEMLVLLDRRVLLDCKVLKVLLVLRDPKEQ